MRLRRFDDFTVGDEDMAGPLVVTPDLLAQFIELTGEAHSLHAQQGVVPASLLQALASGALRVAAAPTSILGIRTMHWRFSAPLRVGVPWFVHSVVTEVQPVDDTVGLLRVRRSVRDDRGNTLSTGDLHLAVGR